MPPRDFASGRNPCGAINYNTDRLFTVPYFPLRSSRSSTHRHRQPFCNWFQMYREGGRRGSQPIFSLMQDRRIKNNSINILPIVIRKKNSTVVWIRDHMCRGFGVWFPGAEPSPLPLKDKNCEENYQNDIFYSSFVNGYGVYETYIAHPTSLGSITLTKTVPCVKVWSRLLVHLHIVCSCLTIHRVSHLKKYHAHSLKVMQFILLIPLNVKLTVFITFMILLGWRKRLNTTGNWRLVNGTEQRE